jgi:hypothetical protein
MTSTDTTARRVGARFKPTLADLGGFAWEGVPVCQIDDGILIALTINRGKAVTALNAYLVLVLGIHDAPIHGRNFALRYGIGVFEWESDDADSPWSMRLVPKPGPTTVHLHRITL